MDEVKQGRVVAAAMVGAGPGSRSWAVRLWRSANKQGKKNPGAAAVGRRAGMIMISTRIDCNPNPSEPLILLGLVLKFL